MMMALVFVLVFCFHKHRQRERERERGSRVAAVRERGFTGRSVKRGRKLERE
jgi:hypothetical protein